MHRLPSKAIIWRLRMAAVLLWFFYITFVAFVAGMVYAFVERSREGVELAIILMAAFVICAISQWLAALRGKCPLCITPVLAAKNCSKNRNAKKFLGSYRLRAANSIMFRNYFRCPYCGEPTELVVRERHSRR